MAGGKNTHKRCDYYNILGISRSATATEIRRAYREQALLHHPDKNLDRVVEATERFKLIAEAYSILQDPQKRALYDSCGSSGDDDGDEDHFNVSRARDLFKDVFGAEFAESLARTASIVVEGLGKVSKGAAPHVHAAAAATVSGLSMAAERAGRTSVVRGAVVKHLSMLADEANAALAQSVRAETLARKDLEDSLYALQQHKDIVEAVQKERREKSLGWWRAAREWVLGEQAAIDRSFDCKAAATTRKLQGEVDRAQLAFRRSRINLADAEAIVDQAQEEEAYVQQNGASFNQLARAGMKLMSNLSGKVLP